MKKTTIFATVAIAATSLAQAQLQTGDSALLAGFDFTNASAANYTDLPNGTAADGGSNPFGTFSFALGPNPGFVQTVATNALDVPGNQLLDSPIRVAGINDTFNSNSAGLNAADAGFAGSADGGYFDFAIDTSSADLLFEDFTFSFAAAQEQSGTSTVDILYSLDGNNFTGIQQEQISLSLLDGAGETISASVSGIVTDNIIFRVAFTDIDTATQFDNLQVSGVTAVPEPSTYAAIAGALALGFVAYRRRK